MTLEYRHYCSTSYSCSEDWIPPYRKEENENLDSIFLSSSHSPLVVMCIGKCIFSLDSQLQG